MSIKKRARRIDLDTEEHIYHLKVTPIGRTKNEGSFKTDEQEVSWGVLSCLSSTSEGQISRYFWCLGVKVASSPALPTERDCAISPGGHHSDVSSPSCCWLTPTRRERGTWSQGESFYPPLIALQIAQFMITFIINSKMWESGGKSFLQYTVI